MLHVLFVCEHNSARSQMAEAYLQRLGGDEVAVESCGLEAGILNPLVVEVMAEEGFDLSGKTTQAAFDLIKKGRSYDAVITVCSQKASEQCPLFPGRALRLNWPFDDPSRLEGSKEEKLARVREIREQIKAQVTDFLGAYRAKGVSMLL